MTNVTDQFADQLFQRNIGVFHQRFHGVDVFQAGIEVNWVVDAKHRLADSVATARRTPLHLLVKNPRADTTHENQVANSRNIDTRGEQVNCDGDARVWLILVLTD
ncbi:hypothetical protein D3C81_1884670 [compost metagenome]